MSWAAAKQAAQGRRERRYWEYRRDRGRSDATVRGRSPTTGRHPCHGRVSRRAGIRNQSSSRRSAGPRRELERTLERRPVVDRLPVRLDDVLERQVEHGAQRRKHALLVPRRGPYTKHALALREGIGEDERPLLRQPERRFVSAAAVVERDEAAGQL